jgi:hypothetical protein
MRHHRRRGSGKEQPSFPQNLVDPLINAGLVVLGRYIDHRVDAFLVEFLGATRDKFTRWKNRSGGLK